MPDISYFYEPGDLWGLFVAERRGELKNWTAVPKCLINNIGSSYLESLYFHINGSSFYEFHDEDVSYLRITGFEPNFVDMRDSDGGNVRLSDFGNQFSIQITLTFERFENYAGVLGLHNSLPGLVFCQYENGQIVFNINDAGARIYVPISVFENKIVNLAYVVNVNTQSLYINGILHQSTSTGNFGTLTNVQPLHLGYSYYSNGRNMIGNIYDLAIYKKVLSETEIANNYEISKAHYMPEPSTCKYPASILQNLTFAIDGEATENPMQVFLSNNLENFVGVKAMDRGIKAWSEVNGLSTAYEEHPFIDQYLYPVEPTRYIKDSPGIITHQHSYACAANPVYRGNFFRRNFNPPIKLVDLQCKNNETTNELTLYCSFLTGITPNTAGFIQLAGGEDINGQPSFDFFRIGFDTRYASPSITWIGTGFSIGNRFLTTEGFNSDFDIDTYIVSQFINLGGLNTVVIRIRDNEIARLEVNGVNINPPIPPQLTHLYSQCNMILGGNMGLQHFIHPSGQEFDFRAINGSIQYCNLYTFNRVLEDEEIQAMRDVDAVRWAIVNN